MTDLDQTRRHLADIPDLYALLHDHLPEFLAAGSVPVDPDEHQSARKRPGSTPPIRLEVIDLLQTRKLEGTLAWLGWDGGDPDRDLRHGVHGTLELWIMLIMSELPDAGRHRYEPPPNVTGMCTWLAYDLDWIVDHHTDFAKSISRIHRALQQACGVRSPLKLNCPKCGEPAFLDETGRFLSCAASTLHAIGIDQIEQRWRRRPPRPTREVVAEFPITAKELHNASRGARPKITPVIGEDGVKRWLPWDVLRLLNPDLADAFDVSA